MIKTGLGIVLVCTCAVGAQGPEIAWEETFDDSTCFDRAKFHVTHRYTNEGWNDRLLIKELKGGTLRFGLRYDKARYEFAKRRNDQVNLEYGDLVWGRTTPKWGPFDLKRYPIVEIRWRGTFLHLYYAVQNRSGKKHNSYVQWRGKPDEWQTVIWRVAADSSVPGPQTASRLLGIDPMIIKPPGEDAKEGSDSVLEFDYIRVRGLTAQEAAEEAKVTAILDDFPRGRWSGLDEFFPWGVYEGYLRSVFEYWGGDYEGAYGNYTRHHFNLIPSNDEVTIGRVRNDPKAYIKWMRPLVDAANATGMRLSADIRGLARSKNLKADEAVSIMKELANAYASDEVVVSWKVYDEPSVKELLPVARVIRAIHEADPLQRPAIVEFNSHVKFGSFAPYLNINCWDHYPIKEGVRDPWSVRLYAREYRELLPDKPMWVLLPAFEGLPPVHDGYFTRPSDAEFRMMTYLAIAEGAKGVMWFIGWFSAADFVGLVDRTGLGRGGMMDTLSDLGARVVPIGKQLLATDPVEDPKIEVIQLVEPKEDGHLIGVSALKHREDDLHVLVAVNEDLDRPRSAQIALPPVILDPGDGAGQGVYDLYALDGKNLARSGESTFTVSRLAGGDGRFYAVCDEQTFRNIRARILCDKALEDVRVLKPDLSIARRWGLDLNDVDRAIESCHASARADAPEQALTEARLARALLFGKIRSDSELNSIRRALSDMQKELAETSSIAEYFSLKPKWWTGGEHRTMVPNPGFLELSRRYWQVGRSYRDLYPKYLAGDKEGLWEKANKARVECLDMRIDVLAFLREKLKPEKNPPTQPPAN
jgi:hypothetical protein